MKVFIGLLLCFLIELTYQMSQNEKNEMLKAHNDYRSEVAQGKTSGQPEASDMLEMVWSEELARIAEGHAKKCKFAHDGYDARKTKEFQYVGQNIYGGWEPKDAVKMWFDEYKDYQYSSKRCSGVCGHYTQIAWAKSYAVGCAVVNCEHDKSFGMKFFVACNYGPAGNFNNEHPYQQGKACSKCPSGTKCKNSLCSK